ncbi:MAG TPA: hypothetical protein VMM60_07430, partial [Ilumatobacter sp.]|nr:hypothetical protein [Ilumatobacter sp.]
MMPDALSGLESDLLSGRESDPGPAAARRRATAFRVFVVSAPLIVAVLWVLWVVRFDPWVAHNDFAVMRVSLERMLDGHVPTVGTYSRLGVYHPGPLREWLFVVPYALGGGRAATLPATALVINLGWLTVCGWLSVRAGAGACRVAICAGATVLVIGIGPNLASPWNPHLAIIPLYAACWAVALLISRRERDVSIALAAVGAASFAAQMHASALPAAGLLLCTAIVVPVARRWGSLNRWCVMPLVVAVVLWIGVLIDLRHLGNSNLVGLVQAGSGSTLGLSTGSGLTSRLLWPQTVLLGESIRPSAVSLIGFSRFWVGVVVVTLCGTALWSRSWSRWSWWPR